MERDGDGKITKFDIGDIITVKGNRYLIDKSAADNLNTHLKYMQYYPGSERDLGELMVSLRRFDSPVFPGVYSIFTHREVFTQSLVESEQTKD